MALDVVQLYINGQHFKVMIKVLVKGLGGYQNVIQVDQTIPPLQTSQYHLHYPLKCSRGITEAKGHSDKFNNPLSVMKVDFGLTLGASSNCQYPEAKSRDEKHFTKRVENIVNTRERVYYTSLILIALRRL